MSLPFNKIVDSSLLVENLDFHAAILRTANGRAVFRYVVATRQVVDRNLRRWNSMGHQRAEARPPLMPMSARAKPLASLLMASLK